MNLLYKSTRNAEHTATASEAILKGLAEDGGLFVPVHIPKLDVTMEELKTMSYQETAYAVMKQFLTDFTEEELKGCIARAYDSKFDTEVIAPLVKVGDTYHWNISWATIAFKDMALSILPHLLTTAAKENQSKNRNRESGRLLEIPGKPRLQDLRMFRERRSSYFIRRTGSAVCRNCRW